MCVECQRISLKCHRKCLTHTLHGTIFIQWWKFRSSQIYDTFLSPQVWTWYIVMHCKAFRPTKHWKWMKSQRRTSNLEIFFMSWRHHGLWVLLGPMTFMHNADILVSIWLLLKYTHALFWDPGFCNWQVDICLISNTERLSLNGSYMHIEGRNIRNRQGYTWFTIVGI